MRELARRTGITPSYLSDIEHDRRRPSERVWKAIVLAVPVYGGALVDDRVRDLKRNDPDLYARVAEAELAEAVELLKSALDAQKVGCDHAGIGLPGCRTCDPRLRAFLDRQRKP